MSIEEQNGVKFSIFCVVISIIFSLFLSNTVFALETNTTYTVTLLTVEDSGLLKTHATSTAISDAGGKLTYSFPSVPSCTEANFLVIRISDGTTVVREALVPAPIAGETVNLGATALSTKQTHAILSGFEAAQTDSPFFAGFALIILRSPNMSDAEAENIASAADYILLADGGMRDYMVNHDDVTSAKFQDFENALICNNSSDSKDISDFTAMFKNAVNADSTDEFDETQQEAGGMMGEIFISALSEAKIDLKIFLAAFNVAGERADVNEHFEAISDEVENSMEAGISAFHSRVKLAAIITDYGNALSTLGASVEQISRFNTGVENLQTALTNIEAQFADYFENPDSADFNTKSEEIGTAYFQAYNAFISDITATQAEIDAMYELLATGFDTTTSNISNNLPPHLIRQYNATYPGFDASDTSTWPYKPLTEIVPMTWIAEIIAAGGELSYTQDSLAIPNTMPWLNGNGQRATIGDLDSAYPTSFKHFLLLKDDLMIIDHKRGADHQSANSDMAAHRQAEEGFITRLKARQTAISGYTQSNVEMNADEVKALLLLLTHPSI